ncbi:tripartite tricarboxylate transporter TctB family protein [Halomonas sp. HP20-15]|uniref:tripartite tricarboxylate transporter TctB family protein n=1 Tax=Halomonas sp. HP20-15 TaxID=3085901 RepID=UPI0029810CD0|nr:tripartite tricarboxylate transporter TctB family protein [Halomonas sp. HP20-15]MDW5378029.1 tripartite tricarboxylate transporter TctB family protein [Halomonas sp. HP20-15]
MRHPSARRAGEKAGHRPASSLLHPVDRVVALIVLAICAFLVWRTYLFDQVPASLAQNVQPGTFPRLLLYLIVALALLLPFEHLQKRKQGIDIDSDRRERPKPIVFITAVVLLTVVGVMPWLGTYIGLVLAAVALPMLWGERRWKILVPYALLFPTALFWLFASGLQVTFLPGILGHIFR